MRKVKYILIAILEILLLLIFGSAYVFEIMNNPLAVIFDWFILIAYSLLFIPIGIGYGFMIVASIREAAYSGVKENTDEKIRSMETDGETSSLS
jgi:hypothetical protein